MDSIIINIITFLMCVTGIISSSPMITIRRQNKTETYQNNGLFLQVDYGTGNSSDWKNIYQYPPMEDVWSPIHNSPFNSSVQLYHANNTHYKFQLSCAAKCPIQWIFHPAMVNFTEEFVYSMQVTTSRTVGNIFNNSSYDYTSNLTIWELSDQSIGKYECICIENMTKDAHNEGENSKLDGWALDKQNICCHKDDRPRIKDFYFENESTFRLMYPIIKNLSLTYRNDSLDHNSTKKGLCKRRLVTDERKYSFRLIICSTQNGTKYFEFYDTLREQFQVSEPVNQSKPGYLVQIWPDVKTNHIEGDDANFNCTSVFSRVARHTHWEIECKDGKRTQVSGETSIQRNMTIHGINGYNLTTPPIFVSYFRERMRSDMVSITCYVPDWKSNGWVTSTTEPFTVYAFKSPASSTVNWIIGELNRTLTCSATGGPQLDILWKKDGESVSGIGENLKLERQGSQLRIIEVTSETDGKYTCYEKSTNQIPRLTFHVKASLSARAELIRTLIILGSIVFLLIGMTIFYYIVREFQERKRSTHNVKQINSFGVEVSLGEDGKLVSLVPCDYRSIVVKIVRVIFGTKVLGIGNFGKVIRGDIKPIKTRTFTFCLRPMDRWRPRECRLTRPIAIKTFLTFEDIENENNKKQEKDRLSSEKLKIHAKERMEYSFKSILSELKLLTSLKKFGTNSNIVEFYGACIGDIKKMEVYILMELCDEGDLKSYLLSHSSECPENPSRPRTTDLTLRQLDEWCLGISSGLVFLDENNLLHNDLSARNILLNSELVPKISDLGLARVVQSLNAIYKKKHLEPLPVAWLSPEALEGQFSRKSDIWAFGVVMWEIYSCGVTPPTLQLSSKNRLPRGPVNPLVNVDIWDTMTSCWDKDPAERPDSSTLNDFFEDLVQSERRGRLPLSESQMTQTAIQNFENLRPLAANGTTGVAPIPGSSSSVPNYWVPPHMMSLEQPEQIVQNDRNEHYLLAEPEHDDASRSGRDNNNSGVLTANGSIDITGNHGCSVPNYVNPSTIGSWQPDKTPQRDCNEHYALAGPEEATLDETIV